MSVIPDSRFVIGRDISAVARVEAPTFSMVYTITDLLLGCVRDLPRCFRYRATKTAWKQRLAREGCMLVTARVLFGFVTGETL